ncbi:unnamed protein product (macronuclear) [Paramecium tetraurelia]|uniref:Protein kinase domain-containing protein n=1 Tax=Paramecium tetraurelia TaxID=5888 RepID=A0EC12_PARTE|nr:uncharacterized protein GSPATT00025565001 [Paramecium tetraurelia]CAK92829.1 unnamed protein product [Paramecium tetraurelia]|eukprot:XP_001460226.1 hypothetical protein (macronuclear) [Paramecium tetraurelia strain d4-2]
MNNEYYFEQQVINIQQYKKVGMILEYQPKIFSKDQFRVRYKDLEEIYNEEMSPTQIELGYDNELQQSLLNTFLKNNSLMECKVHSQIKNDQLVELFDCFQSEEEYTLILEYMNNANYFRDKIETELKIISTEAKMKSYMSDVLLGLDYLHTQGYIHCDIKLENLFCEKLEDQVFRNVKLGDLGLVHGYDLNTGLGLMPVKCGTANYIAPEITNNAMVSPKIDIWSLGIILYTMSCGYKPTQIQGSYKYSQGPIPFRKFDWKKRSKELQNIITLMLDMDPNKRPSCQELMQHSWFEIDS